MKAFNSYNSIPSRTTRRWITTAIVLLAFAVMLAAGSFWFLLSSQSASQTAVENLSDFYLQEIADQTVDHFQTSLQGQIAQLGIINQAVLEADLDSTESLQSFLGTMKQVTSTKYLAYIDNKGTLYTDTTVQSGISKISNLPELMSSTEPLMTVSETVSDTNLLLISVPLESFTCEGVTFVSGVAGLPLDTLSEQLSLTRESAQTFSCIIDSTGAFIASAPVEGIPNGSNLFSTLERAAVFEGEMSLDSMKRNLEEHKAGFVSLQLSGTRFLGYYTAVPDTEYNLLTIIPYNVVSASMNEFAATLNRNALFVIVALAALFLVMGVLFLRNKRTQDAYVREQEESRIKSEFLSRMSHEIRTPMNGIIGMTTMAMRSTDNPTRMKDYLKKTLDASEHLMALFNDVLDMSRIESGRIEITSTPFNLFELVSREKNLFDPLAQAKGVKLTVKIDSAVEERYTGDALRISQVLNNLLSNAIKFTDAGGQVHLAVTQQLVPSLSDDKPETALLSLVVSDTGCGIADENLTRMFEAFEQETAAIAGTHGGTGLGLSIVKRLCMLMGGSITVTSELGTGTTFTALLPLECAVAQSKEKILLMGMRILVVEDNPVNMEIAVDTLEWSGALVEQAWDGLEGIDVFTQSEPGSFDLVLMDVQMPKMNGLEATRALRNLPRTDAKTVPILAASANAFDKDDTELKEAGMNGSIQKPIRPEEVRRALAKFTNQS